MRTITDQLRVTVEKTVTTPGYLIEFVWDSTTIIRLSSRGAQSWGGVTWVGGRLGKVQVADNGSVELMNGDLAYSSIVLNKGAADIPCRIWKFYNDNPGDDEPVLVFEGVTDGADVGHDLVRITVAPENNRTMYSPRVFIGPAIGFNHLRPPGTKITWNGEVYVFNRSSNQ